MASRINASRVGHSHVGGASSKSAPSGDPVEAAFPDVTAKPDGEKPPASVPGGRKPMTAKQARYFGKGHR